MISPATVTRSIQYIHRLSSSRTTGGFAAPATIAKIPQTVEYLRVARPFRLLREFALSYR